MLSDIALIDWHAFSRHFFGAANFLADPGRRLFWFSLLTSGVLAILLIKLRGHRISLRKLKRVFLSRRYWSNASVRADLRWFVVNCIVKAMLAVLFVGAQLAVTMSVAYALQSEFGTAAPSTLPWIVIAAIYSMTFFVAEDLSRFGLHVAMHRVPLLWRMHQVHHSATVLTPLTLHRVHPVETTLYFIRGIVVFGTVSGVCLYLYGSQLSGLDILGVDALGFLFNAAGANLRHSHIWMSFGSFERWFISPAQHQVHHSSAHEHRDRNFGTCLAVWDRWYDSWVSGAHRPRGLRFGLEPQAVTRTARRHKSPGAPGSLIVN